jgi:hypothetical protein
MAGTGEIMLPTACRRCAHAEVKCLVKQYIFKLNDSLIKLASNAIGFHRMVFTKHVSR